MEKKEPEVNFFIITAITFILIIGGTFFFVRYFSENITLSSIITIILGGILLYLYLKLVKFMKLKSINSEEYEKLLKEKKKYKKKTEKKENRIPLASNEKLESLAKEGEKLNKKFYKGSINFNNYLSFILFSIYFGGAYMGKPFWSIKIMGKITKQIYLNWRMGKRSNLGWRKVFDEKEKDYIYYGFEASYSRRP